MRILRIHHVTLGVTDIDAAAATFERLFGAARGASVAVPAFGIRTADVDLGDDTLELATPASPDNPLARFLQRKGEGFYNLALEVDDLDAAIAELRAKGARVSEPVDARPGLRSAFIAMAATHGLSVQLVQAAPEPAAPLDLTPDEWPDAD